MIEALYIISQDGIPIYSYSEMNSTGMDIDVLFSGLITAIKKFLIEINVGEVQQFATESHQVQIYSKQNYAVVFIFNTEGNITKEKGERLYSIIHEELGDSLEMFEASKGDLGNELNTLLTIAVSKSLEKWKRYLKQSEVQKKIRESLW